MIPPRYLPAPESLDVSPGSGNSLSTNFGYAPQPVMESDKTARISAIFEGISGLFTTAADVYSRINYKPQPTRPVADNKPPDTLNLYSYTDPTTGNKESGFNINPQILMWGGLAIVGFLLFARR